MISSIISHQRQNNVLFFSFFQPFRTTQLIFAGTKAILDKNDIAKVQRGDNEEIIAEPIDKQVN